VHASVGVLKVPLRQDVSGASVLHLGDKARYPHYFGDGLDRQTAAEPHWHPARWDVLEDHIEKTIPGPLEAAVARALHSDW